MREREFLRARRYKKQIDEQWQKAIEEYIEKNGVKELGPADNTNLTPAFNDTFLGRHDKDD